ncbi:MAG: hypothetical protein KDK36_10360, partial [Leptospiraceae bacterium]|nr:hypothetical protein [Leptospiraceae bacterium]
AVYTLEKIIKLKQDIESKKIAKMGKRGPKALLLLHHLFQKPVVSIKDVQSLINLTPKASGDIVQKFLDHSILVEVTNNSRNRIFVFKEYIAMFS